MNYLLDTDTCIYWLKGNKDIEKRVVNIGLSKIFISFVTLSELYYGVYKSKRVEQNLTNINLLHRKLNLMDFNESICEAFGKLKATLEKDGKIIDDADLFIAACALEDNAVLVTNNEKHFKRIHGLKVENWVSE
ncbi:MAG: type II toxin-antitoxin system VapC family toxin [Deltaproteobacteria bacterium]|nr:type II toxin-antitoxin system VapC family toxin [Deltaproteobacteria bacterium]